MTANGVSIGPRLFALVAVVGWAAGGCEPGSLSVGAGVSPCGDACEPLAAGPSAEQPSPQRVAAPVEPPAPAHDPPPAPLDDIPAPEPAAPAPAPASPGADAPTGPTGPPAPDPIGDPAPPEPDQGNPPGPDDPVPPPEPSPDPPSDPPPDGAEEGPRLGACPVFPPSDPWNTDVSDYPVHPNSDGYIARLGPSKALHPDFGTVYDGAPNGIPYVVVSGDQPEVPIEFTAYGSESDPGPYPIPPDAPIEGGPGGTQDRHVIVVDATNCLLYELFRAFPSGSGWQAESGAIFDLRRLSTQRPIGWTSADAAGLPIFPGLTRYDEAISGEINHALRVTFRQTQRAFILPATHWASSSTDPNLAPMGLRLRLKRDVDLSGFSATNQVILRALRRYGMIVADNGGDWFLSGAPDARWNDDELNELKQLQGQHFEAVDTGPIRTSY